VVIQVIGAFASNTQDGYLISPDQAVLVTGANGFIGLRVVRTLLLYGFKRVRCFVRSTGKSTPLKTLIREFGQDRAEIVQGNLLSRQDCAAAAKGISVVYHLAAGVDKTFPGCFLNSVVTTRNLLDALVEEQTLKRFVSISSLAVCSNNMMHAGALIDESCDVETELVERGESYVYGKAKQDEIVREYSETKGLPYVLVRPGVVFGPGKRQITGRVGIDTFGIFLHLGGNNRIPFTYVDNCAEAIVLAGLRENIDGEVINVVDDDLPKSNEFLRLYKQQVRRIRYIPMPYTVFYLFSYLWEKYSSWSEGQLPPAFNRRRCSAYWKGNRYSNRKAKELLGWRPRVAMSDGLQRLFADMREAEQRKT
jgi:nucleoside-diphosphate-sugar epimerase